ncbi:MAG: hypothetical protein P1P87_03670 [Trueperaceae bacterium]|nr:hypothetical protein [Trueperaceae bacterium]
MTFTVGEEVLVEDVRYVVSSIEGDPPTRYRLLATTPAGARVRWAAPSQLHKLTVYVRPRDDTDTSVRNRR